MADRSVRVVLDAAVGGFITGMGSAAQSAVGFARTANRAIDTNTTAMNQLSSTAFKVGVGLTAVAGFAVKSAMDWESAWTGVLKTVSGAPGQLAAVEAGLRDLATSMPESHQNIAAVAEAAGQLGVARENIVSFTRTMVMLGDTTNLTADEAATSMAQFMNIMGTAPSQIQNLGSALVELGNNGASTERQIIEMAQRIAGAGRIVGLSEQNVLGLASAIASTGIEVEAGGTAISQALIAATQAVATNSGALQVWARTADMSAQQFATAWREDPAKAFLAFERGLNKQGQDAFKTLDQLGLSGARVGRVLLNLAGANELLAQSFSDSDRAFRENNALLAEAEKRYDTSAAKAQIAWNQIKDAAIDAGRGLLPVVNGIATAVGGVAESFRMLPGPVQTAGTTLVATAGLALLATAAYIKLAMALKNVGAAMGVSSAASSGAALGSITRNGVKAIGVLAGLSAAFNLVSDQKPASVKEWTRAFLDLEKGGKSAQRALEDLVSVSAAPDTFENMFDQLTAPGWIKASNSITGLIGIDVFKGSRESIDAMDNALTGLVEGGKFDEAARGFDRLDIAAAKNGISTQRLRELLPGYTQALKDAGAESGKTGDAFAKAAGGSDMLGRRLQELGDDPDKAIEALQKMQQEARESSRTLSGFYDSLSEGGGSWDAWKKNLEKGIKATADFNKNITNLTLRGVPDEWIDKWQAAPEKYASLVEAMANATDKELAHIVDEFFNAGSEIADSLDTLPTEVRLAFRTVGTEESMAKLAELVVTTTDLSDKEVRFYLEALGVPEKKIQHVLELIAEYERQHPEVTLDANTKPGEDSVKRFINWLNGQDGDVDAGANDKPGRKDVMSFLRWVNRQNPLIPIDANTSPAKAAVQAFRAYVNGLRIHLPIIGTLGIASGGRIPPGYATGKVPGQPPADPRVDNVMAVTEHGSPLRVRSGEWIVNEDASKKNDNWLRAMNAGLDLNKVFGRPPAFETGGVNDGWDRAYTAQGRGRPASGGPQIVSVDLTGQEVEMGTDGITRFVRGEVQVVLDEAGRRSAQDFQFARRRAR